MSGRASRGHRRARPKGTAGVLGRQAAALFVGPHDFTQFANKSVNNEWRNPVKTVTRFELADQPRGFRIEASKSPSPARRALQLLCRFHSDCRRLAAFMPCTVRDRFSDFEIQECLAASSAGSSPPWAAVQVEGDGFLYKMVRHMVGAVLTVGRGTLEVEAVRAALDLGARETPGDRFRGWNIAPAHGLCLMRVDYGRVPEVSRLQERC